MSDDIAIQRERDAPFFEDWSGWRDLGTPPLYHRYPVGMRRDAVHAPSYHCILMQRLPYDERPGFEVTTPCSTAIARMLRRVPGAYEPKIIKGPASNFDRWYVPAESWRELRAALPKIAGITKRIYARP